MSFDIIVIKPQRGLSSLNDWSATDVADPLGPVEQMRDRCSGVFAGTIWSSERNGLWQQPSGHALEFHIPKGQSPTSLNLCLHFGHAWTDETRNTLLGSLTRLFREFQWQSFAVSDNSAMFENEN